MECLSQCNHEISNNVCHLCGLMFDNEVDTKLEFTKNCPRISMGKSNLLDTITGIPMEVISKAKSNITEKETLTGKKVRNDAKNTFVEIYAAYLECGYSDFNPQKLAKKLKLSRKDVNWCLKLASGTSLTSNFSDESFSYASIVILSPVAYIEVKCQKNNLLKYKDRITQITNEILEKKDILYSSRPEYVACAVIKKFCEINNINTKCFSSNNDISDNALKKCMNDIKEFNQLFKN
jgi:hypothetical protein